MKIFVTFLLVSALLLSLTSCVPHAKEEPSGETVTAVESSDNPERYSGWVPYWDYTDSLLEIPMYGDSLTDVIAFAVIFRGEDNALLFLDAMTETVTRLRSAYSDKKTIYLSVTNDVQFEDGTILQKDTDVLRRIFATDKTMDAHIDELLSAVENYGTDGLEIDYEAIRKDRELWSLFVTFIERLYARTQHAGLPLRVAIGSSDVHYAEFPTGPEYVVMCYNLFGMHSKAGPKADALFLRKTFADNRSLPGKVSMAFANGGFDWGSDGKCTSVTQEKALALMNLHSVDQGQLRRDSTSRSLTFSYNTDGVAHEVWFADQETLTYWISLARESGYDSFAIWRFGGNVDSEIQQIIQNPSY